MRLIAISALLLAATALPVSAQDDVTVVAEPSVGKSETIGAGGRPVGKTWSSQPRHRLTRHGGD